MNSIYTMLMHNTPNGTTSNTVNGIFNNVLSTVTAVAGGIIAIILVYSIIKDALAYAKGDGQTSIMKIIGKVIFLIVCIGLIVLASTNWLNLGKQMANVGSNLLNKGTNIVNEIGH